MKLMGSVNAGRLDLVLMNREAYDMLSKSGYLLELAPLLSEEAELSPASRFLRWPALPNRSISASSRTAGAFPSVFGTWSILRT